MEIPMSRETISASEFYGREVGSLQEQADGYDITAETTDLELGEMAKKERRRLRDCDGEGDYPDKVRVTGIRDQFRFIRRAMRAPKAHQEEPNSITLPLRVGASKKWLMGDNKLVTTTVVKVVKEPVEGKKVVTEVTLQWVTEDGSKELLIVKLK
jgi:hypothetical protein